MINWIDETLGYFTEKNDTYTIVRIEEGKLRIIGEGWKKSAWERPARFATIEGAKRVAEIICQILHEGE